MIQKDKLLHFGVSGALTFIFQIGIMYGTRLNVTAIPAVLASAVVVFAMGWFDEKRDSVFSWADIRANVYGIATVVLATLLINVAYGQDTATHGQNTTYESYDEMTARMDREAGYSLEKWKELQRPITIQDALDYAGECYNDSVHYYDVPSNAVWYIPEVGEYIGGGKDTLYFHTKPTWQGFVGWLLEVKL